MKALVFSGHDVRDVLRQIDAEVGAGFRPTLAIAFLSPAHDHAALGRALRARKMAVVGATTAGEIACATVLEESCAVMALEIDPDAFAIRLFDEEAGATTETLGRRLGSFAVERFHRPVVFAFASGLETDGEAVVRGVYAGAGRGVPLYGGLAADDLRMENTYVFNDHGHTASGLAGLVLDGDRYEVCGISTSGWQPVGVEKVVTHSEGNVVHTLDGVPALDVYRQYFELGEHLNTRTGIVMDIGVQHPLSVQREDGDTVIRTPLVSVPDSPSLVFAGGVPEGARVKFCIPPSFEIIEQVVAEAGAVQQALPEADALLLVSCKARHLALGPMVEDEIQGLYELWRAPLLGYFAYGEMGPGTSGRCDFHNETCTLVALRESRT